MIAVYVRHCDEGESTSLLGHFHPDDLDAVVKSIEENNVFIYYSDNEDVSPVFTQYVVQRTRTIFEIVIG